MTGRSRLRSLSHHEQLTCQVCGRTIRSRLTKYTFCYQANTDIAWARSVAPDILEVEGALQIPHRDMKNHSPWVGFSFENRRVRTAVSRALISGVTGEGAVSVSSSPLRATSSPGDGGTRPRLPNLIMRLGPLELVRSVTALWTSGPENSNDKDRHKTHNRQNCQG